MNNILPTSQILTLLKTAVNVETDGQLAKWLGVTPQAISQARKNDRVPESWPLSVSRETGVSLDYLYYGKQSTRKKKEPDDLLYVPLVAARLSAGGGSFETEGEVLCNYSFRRDWLMRKGSPKDMVLMRVSGNSMEPAIFHNDLVLIDQSKTSVIPLSIYAVGVDDGIYVKQLELLPGKRLVLHSFNARYSPMEIHLSGDLADSVRIIGKVVWWCHEE